MTILLALLVRGVLLDSNHARISLRSVMQALQRHGDRYHKKAIASSHVAHVKQPYCDESLPFLIRRLLIADTLRALCLTTNVSLSQKSTEQDVSVIVGKDETGGELGGYSLAAVQKEKLPQRRLERLHVEFSENRVTLEAHEIDDLSSSAIGLALTSIAATRIVANWIASVKYPERLKLVHDRLIQSGAGPVYLSGFHETKTNRVCVSNDMLMQVYVSVAHRDIELFRLMQSRQETAWRMVSYPFTLLQVRNDSE